MHVLKLVWGRSGANAGLAHHVLLYISSTMQRHMLFAYGPALSESNATSSAQSIEYAHLITRVSSHPLVSGRLYAVQAVRS